MQENVNPLTKYKQSVTLKKRKAKIFFYQISEIIYAGSAWIPNIHNYIVNGTDEPSLLLKEKYST